jgi:pimeloyl-ACP methyl ester carboxylesterase
MEAQNATYTDMMRDLIPRFLAPGNVTRPEVMDVMLKQAHETGLNAYIQHQHAMIRPRDYRDLLPNISCPVMVACGREDAVTTVQDHRDLAADIPNAEMVVIEGSGHMVPLEAPQATTNLLMDWLEMPLSIAA